jgi:hypothetical protein
MNDKTLIDDLLDEVSEEDVAELNAVLAKLGLKDSPKPVKHPKAKMKGELTTYNLKVIYNCSLCQSIFPTIFIMEAGDDGTFRIGREVKIEVPCLQTRQEKIGYCKNCTNFLQTQSKEELILRILKMVRI